MTKNDRYFIFTRSFFIKLQTLNAKKNIFDIIYLRLVTVNMLNYISNKSTLFLLKQKIITNEQLDIFIYGFSLFYSTTITAISIMLISFILHNVAVGLIFIAYFSLPRCFIGGYHAPSYRACFIISNFVFIICIISAKLACTQAFFMPLLISYAVSLSYLYYRAFTSMNAVIKNTFFKLLTTESLACLVLFLLPISHLYPFVMMATTIAVVLLTLKF